MSPSAFRSIPIVCWMQPRDVEKLCITLPGNDAHEDVPTVRAGMDQDYMEAYFLGNYDISDLRELSDNDLEEKEYSILEEADCFEEHSNRKMFRKNPNTLRYKKSMKVEKGFRRHTKFTSNSLKRARNGAKPKNDSTPYYTYTTTRNAAAPAHARSVERILAPISNKTRPEQVNSRAVQQEAELINALARTGGEIAPCGLTYAQINLLMNRELGPNDYDLLLLLDETVPKKTAKKEDLESNTKEFMFSNAANTEELGCSICLSNFVLGDKLTEIIACGHQFHSACISKWLLECSRKCPLDQASITNEDKPGTSSKTRDISTSPSDVVASPFSPDNCDDSTSLLHQTITNDDASEEVLGNPAEPPPFPPDSAPNLNPNSILLGTQLPSTNPTNEKTLTQTILDEIPSMFIFPPISSTARSNVSQNILSVSTSSAAVQILYHCDLLRCSC